MKTKLFKIVILIFTFLFVVNGHSQNGDSTWSEEMVYLDPDTCYLGLAYGNPSRDQGPETVWLKTGMPSAGGVPYDILYVNDETQPWESRVFIYTERKLFSKEMEEYSWDGELDLSEYGSQTLFKLTQPLLPRSREKHLAFNPTKHELYCLTQDLKILIIDPLEVEIIGEIIPDTGIGLLDWAILKYDPVSKYIFLGLCKVHGIEEAELVAFNTTDYSNEYSISIENLNDFSFNPAYSLLYLSSNSEIQVRNTLDGTEINSYPMSCHMGVIVNAYNGKGLNKTYCLPTGNITVEDNALIFTGDNTTPQMKSLAKSNFGCGIYNAPSDKVYIGYTSTETLQSGFISFDPDIENMTDHPLEYGDIFMDMTNLEERVFMSTRDHIYCCKNGTNYPDYTLNSPDSYFYRIAATNYLGQPKIWVTNMMDQSLQIANAPAQLSNLEWYEPEPISGVALQGFFNHANQKLYLYYGRRDGDHKFMYICDPVTEEITSVKIDHNPTSLVFDEETQIIYFSIYFKNSIKRYDAEDNSWLEPVNLPEGYSSCYDMYLSDRKLYCTAKYINQEEEEEGTPHILIYDLDEPMTNPVIIPLSGFIDDPHIIKSYYTVDEAGRVYASIRFDYTNQGRVFRINEDHSTTDFGINFVSPDEILYDQLQDKILLKYVESDNISILDFEASPHSYQNFQPREGLVVIDMEIDPVSNLIYFDYYDNDQQDGYIDIYTTNGTFVKTVQVGYLALELKYNPNNGLMYVHVPANFAANRKEQLWSIAPGTFNVYSMDLGQNEGRWRNGYYLTDLILDEENNKIYTVSAHGNFKIITCTKDQLTLQPRTWNWISFPRLDRIGNDPVSSVVQLEKITPSTSNLDLSHIVPLTKEEKHKTKINGVYSGSLNEVQSTLGYKLQTDNITEAILPMTGTVLAEETTLPLYSNGIRTNWTGYFLPMVQSPFDAIGEEFLEHMNMLKGQYWTCTKKDPGHTKSTGSIWACACQQGRVEIKYGDMIEIYPTEDIPGFHWQTGWMQQESEPKPPSLSFQYEEQAEYDALFIELDTLDLPDEIGAFAGDSCIGATTILPGDTMALICAYTEGFEGEEITFELLYPTKSARPRCRDYTVLNTTTGIREQRRIVAGENQPYFLVSLKSEENIVADEAAFNVNIRPNPAKDEFTVSYFTGQEVPVEYSLINSLGLPVKSWQRGLQGAGNYSMTISTAGLPSGCYYLKVKAGSAVEIQKIIIIH